MDQSFPSYPPVSVVPGINALCACHVKGKHPKVESLRDPNNIALALSGGIQGAITIPSGFFEYLRMLIIPRNSLKFRLLVDSNPTFARSNIEP